MLRRNIILMPALLGLALAACGESAKNDSIAVVNGANAAAPVTAGPAPAETRGQEFVSAVLGGYEFVLASARLANSKAERPETKQLAQTISTGLGASLDRLKNIATAGDLKLEPTAGPTDQGDLGILSSTNGAPFDAVYAEQQIDALTELVGLIRAYKNGGDNAELKAWAEISQAIVNERLMDMQSLKAVIDEAADS